MGGGLTWGVRIFGSLAFRKEAMGFGDVTLMGMIGAFLGWQAAVMTFFLGAFLGLGHAVWKFGKYLGKLLSRRKVRERRPRITLRPLSEHGGRWLDALVALALARLGPRLLRHAPGVVFWWLLGFDLPE